MTEIKPNIKSELNKKQQIEQMFDGISSSYDTANRFISLGMDVRWKRRLITLLLKEKPESVLDLATGTADLPLMMAAQGLKNITGLDLSAGMLEVGKRRIAEAGKRDGITLVQGDSENLPFSDSVFDAVTVSYGLRNYENLNKGLKETLRVMKPGGAFLILETSVPQKFPIKQAYRIFTKGVMPLLGKFFSGDKGAYDYLSDSAAQFPCGEALVAILLETGFKNVIVRPQFMGVASIYYCVR